MSKVYFINYASNGFKNSQEEGLKVAESFGFLPVGYTDSDLDENFKQKNKVILDSKRGGGYWLWKPYIILDMLNKIENGDYLIYMDSGAKFTKSPINILRMINHKGILVTSMLHPQGRWTKGDCFQLINKISPDDFRYDLQIQASYLFLRKCEFSVNFIKNWLELCESNSLITDEPSKLKSNFPEFIDHRHDQSILSLLVYNNDVMYIPQIDQYCKEWGYGEDWIYVDRHGRR